jgi:hypothetical protein
MPKRDDHPGEGFELIAYACGCEVATPTAQHVRYQIKSGHYAYHVRCDACALDHFRAMKAKALGATTEEYAALFEGVK